MTTKTRYKYGIVRHNYPELARETVLVENDYKDTKYALIEKQINKDQTESIVFIHYSDSLEALSGMLKIYPTWYNYPIGITKNIQGYLRELP